MKKLRGVYTKKGLASLLDVKYPTLRTNLRRGKELADFEEVETEDGFKLMRRKSTT